MAKKKNGHSNGNGSSLNSISFFGLSLQPITPLTKSQKLAFEEYSKGKNLVLTGAAGTGKSFISLFLLLKDLILHKDLYHKILIIKSIVPTRDVGFLPGTLDEKIRNYKNVYCKLVNELFGRDDAFSILESKDIIEFTSTTILRGETFNNTLIIVDEVQNMTFHELDTIITRMGKSSKIVFVGDEHQMDVPLTKSGLKDFFSIIRKMKSFEFIEFDVHDIVRSGLVKEYLFAKYNVPDYNELYDGETIRKTTGLSGTV